MRIVYTITTFIMLTLLYGCGSRYSASGSNIGEDVKTFQVNYFKNEAEIVEPGIERIFTQRLQDLIQNQTRLDLTDTGGDLVYEGEITEYKVTPMQPTAGQLAAQNRLTVTVNVRFKNNKNENDNFEQTFSFYYDYNANFMLRGTVLTSALEEIFEKITQDIFNASLAKW
ncbi:hypothetical protein GR160_07140 [Flavobacterium sp. Sd200]|uniref:LptE family protein n=1 Tax=Flavobacterium sp. Sd200 TaxID=2692211 RepID=UPI001369F38B|nr:LptE family protein [Flavobacterium sp. Sd200]MXN91000.1 hypothetical protein [Flavobacterium sp. Sd200]